MINSPKIAKHIELGETKDILDEIESSVGYYRMQSMNQSLLALLVHRKISYEKAMEISTDPEDLSLKLRKLFPQIEESFRGGDMSFNDFSIVTGLMDTQKLYDEQEEKWKLPAFATRSRTSAGSWTQRRRATRTWKPKLPGCGARPTESRRTPARRSRP
jgi:hypothetical protein